MLLFFFIFLDFLALFFSFFALYKNLNFKIMLQNGVSTPNYYLLYFFFQINAITTKSRNSQIASSICIYSRERLLCLLGACYARLLLSTKLYGFKHPLYQFDDSLVKFCILFDLLNIISAMTICYNINCERII